MNKRIIDTKIFKVLSYIIIFWIIGLFSPYINEKEVKFHVGQGMILTVFIIMFATIIMIINRFVVANIFVNKILIGSGTSGKYMINQTGVAIASGLRLLVVITYIVFAIIGILNVLKNKDKFLPIIGRYSFINKIRKWKKIKEIKD